MRFQIGEHSSRISAISSKSSIDERSDNIGDHSDAASLADSLEETSSSRLSFKRYDEKPVRGDLPPITIRDRRKLINTKPPDAFFVPIRTDAEGVKSVSDYLPEKLKEKILSRQKNRQDKLVKDQDQELLNMSKRTEEQTKNDSKSKHMRNKSRFRKPLLPSIETFRKSQRNSKRVEEEKDNTKRSRRKSKDNPHTTRKSKPTGYHHHSEHHFHLYTSENSEGPKRIYHKAELRNNNRRIEILEIMECVDIGDRTNKITTKTKSKIPVLRNQNLTKTCINPFLIKKATYLDFGEVFKADPNLDQLITDILMQSLSNNKEIPNSKPDNQSDIQEGSTVIPQEITFENEPKKSEIKSTNESAVQVSGYEIDENNTEQNQVPKIEKIDMDKNYNEATATKDTKEMQTLTPDWLEFHPTQKKEDPSDLTSNEGIPLI